MIELVASAAHYRAHADQVMAALPADLRGHGGAALVASWLDHRAAVQRGHRSIAVMHHGIGQSYSNDHPAYAGGARREAGLFLVPNAHAGGRWHKRYPAARVEIVGSPILDTLPAREPGPGPVIAVSFHWDGNAIAPEHGSALRHYAAALGPLAREYEVLGHSHPKINLGSVYRRHGIRYTRDFEQVARHADLFIADNTSALYEFAATGRPVLLLNSPRFRLSVNHGLRFEPSSGCPIQRGRHFCGAAHVGIQVNDPAELLPAVERALLDREEQQERREAALRIVYAHRSGAAERAAAALAQWMTDEPPIPVEPQRLHQAAAVRAAARATAAPIRVPMGTITVSMPYRGVPDLVGRAVRSVLAQTYRDLRLIVIGDGEVPPLEGIEDPRLVVHVLPESRGAYFAHAVALEASPDAWYAPHDADDYSDPDHLARLVELERVNGTGAVISGVIWKHIEGRVNPMRTQCWMGLYARSRLLEIGGIDPAERVAQDSHLVAVLQMAGRVVSATRPTYHHVRRPGSLTQDPETAIHSAFRDATKQRNKAQLLRLRSLDTADIGNERRQGVPLWVAAAVEREASRLRMRLEVAAA